MSYWNFRVCAEKYPSEVLPEGSEGMSSLTVREVYYNQDGSIWAVSENEISAHGEIDADVVNESEALKELKADLQRMQECTKKPILNLDTIEFAEHELDYNDTD